MIKYAVNMVTPVGVYFICTNSDLEGNTWQGYIAFCGFKKNNMMIIMEATRSHVVLPNIKMEKISMF